jgi:hypothetical protein
MWLLRTGARLSNVINPSPTMRGARAKTWMTLRPDTAHKVIHVRVRSGGVKTRTTLSAVWGIKVVQVRRLGSIPRRLPDRALVAATATRLPISMSEAPLLLDDDRWGSEPPHED